MSLDETLEQMQYFARELDEFNLLITQSMRDLEHNHSIVDPIWQDSFRQNYDQRWQHFAEFMRQYLQREAPTYSRFLHEKMIRLQRYLHG